jgi:inner membrane protein involved in colicin E2 resistance
MHRILTNLKTIRREVEITYQRRSIWKMVGIFAIIIMLLLIPFLCIRNFQSVNSDKIDRSIESQSEGQKK